MLYAYNSGYIRLGKSSSC